MSAEQSRVAEVVANALRRLAGGRVAIVPATPAMPVDAIVALTQLLADERGIAVVTETDDKAVYISTADFAAEQ
jgi:hypothetical protein